MSDLFATPETCSGCRLAESRKVLDFYGKAEEVRVYIAWVPYIDAFLCEKCRHLYTSWMERRMSYESENEWNKAMPECVRAAMEVRES